MNKWEIYNLLDRLLDNIKYNLNKIIKKNKLHC